MSVLPTYAEAIGQTLSVVKPLGTTENVECDHALHRILATDIVADRDLPPFNRAQMDGYAVVSDEVSKEGTLEVLGHVAAGATIAHDIRPMSCVSIATGAPVPDPFDAVVQHELTDCGEDRVTFYCEQVSKGAAIHPKGADASAGDVLATSKTKVSPQLLGIAASVGVRELEVCTKPKMVLLSSGDEIVEVHETPLSHQIRNGNREMIAAAFSAFGCSVIETCHLPDDAEITSTKISEVLQGECDLLVTVGGISAGKRDFFPEAFSNAGVENVVKGANIQPGKPIIVGAHTSGLVLGLPGNPVSALACSVLFGWPITRGLLGCSTELPWQTLPLAHSIQSNPSRTAFRPAKQCDGSLYIPTWQGSGDAAHTIDTNGLAQLPPSTNTYEQERQVMFLPFPW